MTLSLIRLELARDHDHPNGSSNHGYELKAPLTPEGFLDAEGWRKHRKACTVRRFWDGEPDEEGYLRHTQGGGWRFHYDSLATGDDEDEEMGFKFDKHCFLEGEYVSLVELDDVLRTFRVVSVKRLVV